MSGIAAKLKKACCFDFDLQKTILSTDFCSSSSSPSFQPIKSHVTIPTAHVVPSALGTSPAKPNPAAGPSSKLPFVRVGWKCGDDKKWRPQFNEAFSGLSRDFMYLCGAAGESGVEQSWFPAVGHEERRSSEKVWCSQYGVYPQSVSNAGDTLFRSPLPSLFPQPKNRHKQGAIQGLPETKKGTRQAGAACERNGPHLAAVGFFLWDSSLLLGSPSLYLLRCGSQILTLGIPLWRSCELSTCSAAAGIDPFTDGANAGRGLSFLGLCSFCANLRTI